MISLDKTYKTRDGREVRLLMVDGGGQWPVIGAYRCEDGDEADVLGSRY